MNGVRQDFVIEAPPLNSPPSAVLLRRTGQPSTLNPRAGALRLELDVTGARAEPLVNGAQLVLDGSGRKLAYSRLRVVDAAARELRAQLEVITATRLAVVVDDAAATYPVRIDPTFSDADWVSLNVLPNRGTEEQFMPSPLIPKGIFISPAGLSSLGIS